MKHTEEEILKILANKGFVDSTEVEKAAILSWMKADAANQRLVTDIHFLEMYQNDAINYKQFEPVEGRTLSSGTRKVAIVLFSLFVSASLLYYFFGGSDSTKNGLKYTFLPDNSEIQLAKGGSFTLADDFNVTNRQITVDGSMFLDVSHNKELPFVIVVDQGTLTVVGTSFSVEEQSDKTHISVFEGNVLLRSKSGKAILLKKGQNAIMDEEEVVKVEKENDWPGLFTKDYNNANITEVLGDLSETSGLRIELKNELKNCEFNGSFSRSSISEIFRELSIVFDLKYQKNDKTILITELNCD